jgi:hypothetical protein
MGSKPLAKLLLVLAGLLDLGEHPSLEPTVWKKDGSVLVVAAHTRFTAPASRRIPWPSPGRTRRCCSAWGWCR